MHFKFSLLAIAALTMCSCSSDSDSSEPETPATPQKSWTLEWSDEFNNRTLNSAVWQRIPAGSSDWNKHMSTADEVFDWTDSTIVLKGINTPAALTNESRPYITGGIETRGLKKFTPPFKLEIRARLGSAQGAWPAFWMMPFAEDKGWPECGEIDIMEHLNFDSQVYQSIHSAYFDTQGNDNPLHYGMASIKRDDFNTYTIAVTLSYVIWYINGVETFRYKKLVPEVSGQYPFFVPQFLRLDMQLGGSWVGSVATSQLPVDMEIDYVRYYKYK